MDSMSLGANVRLCNAWQGEAVAPKGVVEIGFVVAERAALTTGTETIMAEACQR